MSRDRGDGGQVGSGGQRRIPAPRVAPGPLRELKTLLYRLYLEARTPPVARIAELIAADPGELLPGSPSKDTVHRIIGSDELPAQQANVVSVAAVLAREAGWNVADVVEQVRSAWVKANLIEPLGRPLSQLDAYSLEVHRSITVPGDEEVPLLPTYVVRDHDHRVREAIDRGLSGGAAVVTLVGESSTGKTRTLWEAIQLLPAKWRLWQALDCESPADLAADLEKVGPHTVVWLNEAQRFLLTADPAEGEHVAAALRRIVQVPERRSVLILVTLWPEYWDQLTSEPSDDQRDLHPHARHLLAGTSIRVPVAFLPEDLANLHELGTRDARLAQAAERAEQHQVTQYLAGVPALIERYRTAASPVRALIDAAMDLRRLGHGEHLPLDLLEAAAYEYMTDMQFDLLPEDWLETALAHAAKPQRGIRGPLTRVRPRNRKVTGSPVRYRLSDPLDQLGRSERGRLVPPPGLWDLLVHHSTPADAPEIGESAEARGLYRIAAVLYKKSADSGSGAAALRIAELLSSASRMDEAIEWYEEAHSLGEPKALNFAGQALVYGGDDEVDWDSVKSYYVRSASQGDIFALHDCREQMREYEYDGDADEWMDSALHEVLARVSLESAVAWYEKSGSDYNLGRLLIGMKRRAKGLHVLEQSALRGDFRALFRLCEEKRICDGPDSVISYLRELGSGRSIASTFAPMALERYVPIEGRGEEFEALLKEMIEAGNESAVRELVDLLRKVGRGDEAIDVLCSLEVNGSRSSCELARALRRASRTEEAISLLVPLAAAGNPEAQHQLAQILEEKGDLDEALIWYRASAEAGQHNAASGVTRLLLGAQRANEALTWLRSISDPDEVRDRIDCAERVLRSMGRAEDARRIGRYGWEADGAVSGPWSVAAASAQGT